MRSRNHWQAVKIWSVKRGGSQHETIVDASRNGRFTQLGVLERKRRYVSMHSSPALRLQLGILIASVSSKQKLRVMLSDGRSSILVDAFGSVPNGGLLKQLSAQRNNICKE